MDVVNESPICTFDEVAEIVGMPAATLRVWARPTPQRPPLVHTAANAKRGWPTIPLAGLVEARSLRAIRTLASMQKIVPVVAKLREETGDEFVLAKPQLFVDVAGELFRKHGDTYVRIRDNQAQMPEVFDAYLKQIERGPDNTPRRFKIPIGDDLNALYIDPTINAGRPTFANRVPLFVILGAHEAGDTIDHIVEDYEVPRLLVEQAIEHGEQLRRIA
jgi:uncharacterized protein (DUF433 family)